MKKEREEREERKERRERRDRRERRERRRGRDSVDVLRLRITFLCIAELSADSSGKFDDVFPSRGQLTCRWDFGIF